MNAAFGWITLPSRMQSLLKKLKEKLKVVYRDDKVVLDATGRLKVPASCKSKDVKTEDLYHQS